MFDKRFGCSGVAVDMSEVCTDNGRCWVENVAQLEVDKQRSMVRTGNFVELVETRSRNGRQ